MEPGQLGCPVVEGRPGWEKCRTADHEQEPAAVGWEEFEATTEYEIETLVEVLFDVAYLIAGLAAAVGAVLMSKQNELLGFGGMVSGKLPDVNSVWRALDLEGEKIVEEGPATWAPDAARPAGWPARCPDRWRS